MQLASKKRMLIFTVIVTTVVVCSMLSTALTTALPQIMEDFSLNAASGQWLTSIYSLVMGILVLCTALSHQTISNEKPLHFIPLAVFYRGCPEWICTKFYCHDAWQNNAGCRYHCRSLGLAHDLL